MNYKIIRLLILSLLFHQNICGQSFTEKRIIRKTFKVNSDMTLEVNNKYGTIHITSWDIDSVLIRAEIEADATSRSRIDKMLEGISINISETDYLIRAHTEFTQSINMIFESFKGMTNKMIPYDSRVQINYFINMPDGVNLKIVNKYGDVYMENNTANISVSMSNGSFKAKSLRKARDLDLSFCDATIDKVADAVIEASFSELVISESNNLQIRSVSSRFDIKSSDKIIIESRRDKFFLGSSGSLQGNSYFTDFRVDKVREELDLTTRYGSIDADLVENSIKSITINSGYSDISLSFDPSVSYNLDIRHINTLLTLPEKNVKLEKKIINDEKKEFITFGTVGKNPGQSKVKIDATRGEIYLE